MLLVFVLTLKNTFTRLFHLLCSSLYPYFILAHVNDPMLSRVHNLLYFSIPLRL